MTPQRRGRTVPAPALVLGSVVGIQVGHAGGKLLFGLAQPLGVVTLRIGFAAIILCILWRPRLPTDLRSLGFLAAWGATIAGMNTIYLAFDQLPVGMAVSLQFLGPLTVALAGSRRLPDLLWAVLAGLGVLLFYNPFGPETSVSTTGLIFALTSGASWAAYILLTRRFGARHTDNSTLALAVAWAALLSVPIGIATTGPALAHPQLLLGGLAIAILGAVVPWTLDLAALRTLSPRAFGVLVSLEPAVGGLAGLLILGEHLTSGQWLAISSIVAASLGVSWTTTGATA